MPDSAPQPVTPPLRIGILGCAAIARPFARDVATSPLLQLAAVASRDADKAAAFAAQFGIARHHASYEALLADPGVDIVYIPLPNSLHARWAIAAAQAGKHVLCEKPLALDAAEASAMFAAARAAGTLLLEAYPYWFQPQTGALVQLIAEGAIGRVQWVQASFGFHLASPAGNIRFDPALGGGALLDAGSYAVSLVRLVLGEAPVSVQASSSWTDTGVDLRTLGTLHFRDGRMAQIACDMACGVHRRALIVGSQGAIETEFLNHTAEPGSPHPLGWQPSQMRLRRSGAGFAQPWETVASPGGSGFRFAAEALAQQIASGRRDAVERAAQASIDIAATLAALGRSARSGRAEALQ